MRGWAQAVRGLGPLPTQRPEGMSTKTIGSLLATSKECVCFCVHISNKYIGIFTHNYMMKMILIDNFAKFLNISGWKRSEASEWFCFINRTGVT